MATRRTYDPRQETVQVLPYEEYDGPGMGGAPTKTYRHGPGNPTGLGGTTYKVPSAPRGGARPTSASPRMYGSNSTTKQKVQSSLTFSKMLPSHSGKTTGRSNSAHPARPSSAPLAGRNHSVEAMRGYDDLGPRFLGTDGRWIQDAVPMPIAATQSQPLTTSRTFTARLPGTGKPIRPVSAVISYNDVSPAVTAEYIRGTMIPQHQYFVKASVSPYAEDPRGQKSKKSSSARSKSTGRYTGRYNEFGYYNLDDTQPRGTTSLNKSYDNSAQRSNGGYNEFGYYTERPPASSNKKKSSILSTYHDNKPYDNQTVNKYAEAIIGGDGDPEEYQEDFYLDTSALTTNDTYGHPGPQIASAMSNEAYGVRVDPVRQSTMAEQYSQRVNAANFNLTKKDLARTMYTDLGENSVAGSANVRLVGGRWRKMPRPVDGDVLWTDYYGPCGKEKANYYGRRYHDVSNRIY